MGHCVYIIVEFLKTEHFFNEKSSDFERGMIKYNNRCNMLYNVTFTTSSGTGISEKCLISLKNP